MIIRKFYQKFKFVFFLFDDSILFFTKVERKKGTTDGKKDFKQNTVENYIPPEPKKFPKSQLYVTTSESKLFRIERSTTVINFFLLKLKRCVYTKYEANTIETI